MFPLQLLHVKCIQLTNSVLKIVLKVLMCVSQTLFVFFLTLPVLDPLPLRAVRRCSEPAGEPEPAPGPAALGEGRGVSGVHPGRAPHAGTVAARDEGGQHRRAE